MARATFHPNHLELQGASPSISPAAAPKPPDMAFGFVAEE